MKSAPFALIVLLVLGVACGSAPAPAPSRCEPAGAAKAQAIRDGIKQGQPRNDIGQLWAVPSSDFEHVLMVAAMISGPGIEGEIGPGVWAIAGGDEFTHTILSVNVPAAKYSRYADNFQTEAGVTMEDDGAKEAEACALAGAAR